MKGWAKAAVITAVALVVLAVAGGLMAIYSGSYNVAATEPHWGITEWALGTLQHRSVGARAGEVTGSPPTDSTALEHGFDHFHAMCVQCHAAPGMDRGETGKGMRPEPPRLEDEAHEWSDQEIFWITKHGIRLTGMPAFGTTHGDDEIWAIVAFIRQLETMTEQEYGDRVRARSERTDDDGGHSHAPGTPDHAH